MNLEAELPEETLPDNGFFRVPAIACRFIGVWPMDPGNLPFYAYINICLLAFSCIGGAWFTFIHIADIQVSFDALCPTSTETLALFKIITLAYYRCEFRTLLAKLYKFYKTENRPDCMEIYRRETRYGHIVSTILLTLSLSTDVTYILRPIATNVYRYFTGQLLVRELPFQAAYPFDVYNHNYFIIYLVLSQGGNNTGSSIGGIDALFLIICLHISVQYMILKYEIENLISIEISPINQNRKFANAENQRIIRRLTQIINKQTDLFDMHNEFIRIWTAIILMHFLSTALVICFASINLILAKGINTLLYIVYNLAVLVQLYVYAIGGNHITESSSSMAEAIYAMDWNSCNTTVHRMIVLIMLRSQHGINVKVPFFEVSLPAFSRIISSAGSYITLLNSFL